MSMTIWYTLPLMEGIVGFGTLGAVLIGLSWLEDAGIVRVSEKSITTCLFVGAAIGIGFLLFKSTFLLGL